MIKREEAKIIVQVIQEQVVIEPSAGSRSSLIVVVYKKDGSNRFCVEYHRLDAVTQKDSYLLPHIDGTVESLSGIRWLSTLDMRS